MFPQRVPIDNQIQDWTAASLPADWRSIQARWELFHTIRTFISRYLASASSTFTGRSVNFIAVPASTRVTTSVT